MYDQPHDSSMRVTTDSIHMNASGAVERKPTAFDTLDELESALSILDQIIDAFVTKLDPVLTPELVVANEMKAGSLTDGPTRSALNQRLEARITHVRRLSRTIDNTMMRLEL